MMKKFLLQDVEIGKDKSRQRDRKLKSEKYLIPLEDKTSPNYQESLSPDNQTLLNYPSDEVDTGMLLMKGLVKDIQ